MKRNTPTPPQQNETTKNQFCYVLAFVNFHWPLEYGTASIGLIHICDKDLWQVDSYFVQQGRTDG